MAKSLAQVEKDRENLMLYGRCPVCKASREVWTTEEWEPTGEVNSRGFPLFGGTATLRRELRCPNGHPQL